MYMFEGLELPHGEEDDTDDNEDTTTCHHRTHHHRQHATGWIIEGFMESRRNQSDESQAVLAI
jgi:hypothetical protein